jgi:AcrR family transcriptional regulator
MSDRARDPRSIRTVASLRSALRSSLARHELDAVSVSELCREAGVRRTTFYTHYSSVAELLTETLTAEIDTLLELPDTSGMAVAPVAAEFQESLVAAFEVVARDRQLFRVGFESNNSASLRRALAAMYAHRLELALDIWRGHGEAADVDARVAVPFASGGLTLATEAWALSDETDAAAWADSVRDQMPPWWPRGAGD